MGGGGQRDGQSRGEGSGEVTEGRDGRGRVGAMKCDARDGWEAGRGHDGAGLGDERGEWGDRCEAVGRRGEQLANRQAAHGK